MAIVSNPRTLDLDDIQGMIIRGYGKLMETAYFLLKVDDAADDPSKAKNWIKEILPQIDSADPSNRAEKTLHLSFTARGLAKLGMNQNNLDTFPVPFREGISTKNRMRILGDHGDNAPKNWRWGQKEQNLHLVLILHAKDKPMMTEFIAEQKEIISKIGGLSLLDELTGFLREDNKEPFGFHDGISQPTIKGSGRSGPEHDIIATGEFILGYKNEHNQYPYTPFLVEDQGNVSLLANDVAKPSQKDFGRNGTFMVFRQMEQHVDKFWEFMEDKSKNPDGTVNEKAKIKFAAKCVGRWPSGASLVNFPDEDPGGSLDNDDFGYAELDPEGLRCPYGSHLRRNNPRDTFRWYKPKQSLKISNRHRIIRRGRNYQMPAVNGAEKGEEGLQFICFNANLELQFEFIQHAWANNNQLRNLSNDVDIVIGVPIEHDPNNAQNQFTTQDDPVNKFNDNWEQFVTIKGGEYFFLPSMTVLNYLTTI
ncbi:MAG: Dyp-type peroxidase [Flavobacteriales bacterium]|nr:Dyp-type peroxidase [Flavobacteriales bacterium]